MSIDVLIDTELEVGLLLIFCQSWFCTTVLCHFLNYDTTCHIYQATGTVTYALIKCLVVLVSQVLCYHTFLVLVWRCKGNFQKTAVFLDLCNLIYTSGNSILTLASTLLSILSTTSISLTELWTPSVSELGFQFYIVTCPHFRNGLKCYIVTWQQDVWFHVSCWL